MRYRCEILNHGIDGYEVWLHGRNQGRSGVNALRMNGLPSNLVVSLYAVKQFTLIVLINYNI